MPIFDTLLLQVTCTELLELKEVIILKYGNPDVYTCVSTSNFLVIYLHVYYERHYTSLIKYEDMLLYIKAFSMNEFVLSLIENS